MSTMEKTWLILGASSSVSRAFVREVAAAGCGVLLAGRDGEDLAATAADIAIRFGTFVETLDFDARDFASHSAFIKRCQKKAQGELQVFMVFGAMAPQETTDIDFKKFQAMIEANYLGAVSLLDKLAPVLETQGSGNVVVLTSVAGRRGRIKNYSYGSTKAALLVYLQGLRARLFRSGVSLSTIIPGFIDTRMTWGKSGMFLVASPQDMARGCLKAANKKRDIVYLPHFWALVMTIICHIPERIFKRLNI